MSAELDQGLIFEGIYALLEWVPDILGCLGATVILVAYALLQTKKIEADSVSFLFTNFIGAVFILISLYFAWNLAAFAMELAWMIVSLVGLIKLKRYTPKVSCEN